ncbi:MAG TPA: type II secretion system F family protein [Chlamydiales bacterium]|nr:type II secretion system F family protein [Chlamydiales bacterium]
MPLYQYLAISDDGKKIAAEIDADSLQDAKQQLIRRQIVAIKISLLSDKEIQRPLSKKEVLSITRELARLIHAGLALYEGLSILEEKYRGQKPHKILLDLCSQVKIGHPFSKALSRHGNTFDILYVSMVANAEKTGRLEICLNELSHLIARQLQIQKQIVSAFLYPSLLAAFCLVVLSSLLFFVIPSMQELFSGRDLHLLTRIVFAASRCACESKMAIVILLSGSVLSAFAAWRSTLWKKRVLGFCMRLPVLKTFFAKVAFVRFSRAAATLLEGGLPLITVFEQSRTVMRHPVLEQVIARAEIRIAQGEHLSTTFANHPLIPPLVSRMLGIAEQSGKLSFTMQQIAQIYEDELETTLAHFATMAQPILLLLLGGLVGFILLSVLLPLSDVSTFVN